jgi:drug/metabolite transporter (DMT)-like permease
MKKYFKIKYRRSYCCLFRLHLRVTFAFVIYLIIIISTHLKHELLLINTKKENLWLLGASCVCVIVANILICMSILTKNATIAAIIELSYPIFTIIFTYAIFRQYHLNPGTIVGGIFIIIGALIVSVANY